MTLYKGNIFYIFFFPKINLIMHIVFESYPLIDEVCGILK